LKKYQPHILVTPQEFFGGAVMMPHQKTFHIDELLPELSHLAKKHNCALVVGAVEKELVSNSVRGLPKRERNLEVIWFIDEKGIYQGMTTSDLMDLVTSNQKQILKHGSKPSPYREFKWLVCSVGRCIVTSYGLDWVC
jgi:hypothetical protein